MNVEINLGKLLNFYDSYAGEYDLASGDGFRAFILDYVCGYEKEQNEDWADDYTVYAKRPLVSGDILFSSRDEAELILNKMKELIKINGLVTVADYYNIAYQKPESTHYNWGWRDMKGSYVYSYNDHGTETWGIHFPEALLIKHFRG